MFGHGPPPRMLVVLVSSSLLMAGCTLFGDIVRALGGLCDQPVFEVTTTEDTFDGLCSPEDCSLRDAVSMSNTCSGTQTIHLPAGRYELSRTGEGEDGSRLGDLDITDSLILEGTVGAAPPVSLELAEDGGLGWAYINGRRSDRVFHIHPTAVDVRISGVFLESGRLVNDLSNPRGGIILNQGGLHFSDGLINHADLDVAGDTGGAPAGGGGLFNEGSATLVNVQIAGNFTWNGADGAGIYNGGTLTLDQVLIWGNEAQEGGEGSGLFNAAGAQATISRSVFVHGGEDLGGAIANRGSLFVGESAFVNNSGESLYQPASGAVAEFTNVTISGPGGGLWNEAGSLLLTHVTVSAISSRPGLRSGGTTRIANSIIAGNDVDCSGTPPTSLGNNLDGDGTCGLGAAGDLSSVDPLLLPLPRGAAPVGVGPGLSMSLVHALRPGSPAIDAASRAVCEPADQRGVGRPQGAGCDIGAYELGPGDVGPAELSTPFLVPTPLTVGTIPPTAPIGPPLATFTQNANCRRGPATLYDILRSFTAGETAQVDGRSQDEPRWWYLLIPGTSNHCWASDTTVELDRPGDDLPAIASPPPPTATPAATATPQLPAAPDKLVVSNQVCNANQYTVTLGWVDVANNETGYRVYRNGSLIATLGANAEGYVDNPPGSGPYTYGVEAYNAAGASGRPTVEEEGCLF